MKITISLINNEQFVNRVAAEISNLFDSMVNSCSTSEDIEQAVVVFTALASKNIATFEFVSNLINTIINDMFNNQYTEAEVDGLEFDEIRDLIACHAAVHLTLLE